MTSGDKLRDAIEAIVLRLVRPMLTYRTTYLARVVQQNADGTLDLAPIDATPSTSAIPGLTGVPIRTLPGVACTVADGVSVMLSFEGADPGRPVATLFDGSGLKSITIKASATVTVDALSVALTPGAAQGLARVGDVVAVTIAGVQLGTGVVSASGTIMTGSGRVAA